jgi:two-component system, OmpR family, response regulator
MRVSLSRVLILRSIITGLINVRLISLHEIPQVRKSMKVLVIDDNHDIGEVLSVYFEHENIDYELIDNGTEGVKAIRERDFDLILLDMAMPDYSGLDIIRSLKNDGIFESKNIVIFTASSDPKIK